MTDSLLIDCRVWTPAELAGVETLEVKGNLDVRGYAHPLPAGLTSVGGNLDVFGYAHPLPAGLTSVGGDLYVRDYAHPLPAGLTSVGGNIYGLSGYGHPLPAGLTSVGGYLGVRGYAHPLPAWIVDGGADSRGYYFTGMRQSDGWRIKAGCRNYSIDEALAHWGPGGASNRPDCYALVKKIIAEIQQRKEM